MKKGWSNGSLPVLGVVDQAGLAVVHDGDRRRRPVHAVGVERVLVDEAVVRRGVRIGRRVRVVDVGHIEARVLAVELGEVDLARVRPGAVGQRLRIEPHRLLQTFDHGRGKLGTDLERAVGLIEETVRRDHAGLVARREAVAPVLARERCHLQRGQIQVAARDGDGVGVVHVAGRRPVHVAAARRHLGHPVVRVQRRAVELVVEGAGPIAREAERCRPLARRAAARTSRRLRGRGRGRRRLRRRARLRGLLGRGVGGLPGAGAVGGGAVTCETAGGRSRLGRLHQRARTGRLLRETWMWTSSMSAARECRPAAGRRRRWTAVHEPRALSSWREASRPAFRHRPPPPSRV